MESYRILRLFDGFELLAPGLTDVQEWRQDATDPTWLKIAGAVGRKPRRGPRYDIERARPWACLDIELEHVTFLP